MYKRIPGTRDILPNEIQQWQDLEHKARGLFARYNYRELRPPLVEDVSLFNRSLGEATEIVQKQMFLIHHGDETYALRPEATASVVRAYVENNLDKVSRFMKLFYMGPMFRMERPQKGRLRQFHHIGCECIGSGNPALDVEVISLAHALLREFGVSGYSIKLNSLGCADDKRAFASRLRDALASSKEKLCGDCKTRYDQNVLRILDCKQDECKRIVAGLTIHQNGLCAECAAHFSAVRAGLENLGVPYEVTPHLVRGLDYYTRTVFEIAHPGLGAQDAVGAGGRYDSLVKELGGPDIGAIGFAFGVERLLLVRDPGTMTDAAGLIYVIPLGEQAQRKAVVLLADIRRAGLAADMSYEDKSLKGAMRAADAAGAAFTVILGDNELAKGTATLKDMKKSEQTEIPLSELIGRLQR